MTSRTDWSPMWSETPDDVDDEAARWRTPPEVFRPLHREFRFGLDAAALASSAVVPYYLGPDHPNPCRRDAFEADWKASTFLSHTTWINPPYGRGMGRWMLLAARWGRVVPVVALILARTDLPWWHDVVMQRAAEVRLIRGRVRFLRPDGSRASGAPAPSLLIVYRPGHVGPPVFSSFTQEKARKV